MQYRRLSIIYSVAQRGTWYSLQRVTFKLAAVMQVKLSAKKYVRGKAFFLMQENLRVWYNHIFCRCINDLVFQMNLMRFEVCRWWNRQSTSYMMQHSAQAYINIKNMPLWLRQSDLIKCTSLAACGGAAEMPVTALGNAYRRTNKVSEIKNDFTHVYGGC